LLVAAADAELVWDTTKTPASASVTMEFVKAFFSYFFSFQQKGFSVTEFNSLGPEVNRERGI